MNYPQAIDYIWSTAKIGMKRGTENMKVLLSLLDNPHERLRYVHVAGTNGKGSTCSFIASGLQEAGYKTGLYTSPYLEVFNERIRVNGQNIPDQDVARLMTLIQEKVSQMMEQGHPHPTEFELITAMAFLYYEEQKVDFVVLEVGLGGRLDSTNVIPQSDLSVIVSLSIDHIEQLGGTLEKIAYEKAGILKPGTLLVLYPQKEEARQVVLQEALAKQVPVYEIDPQSIHLTHRDLNGQTLDFKVLGTWMKDVKIQLIGDHQQKNALTAATALALMNEKGLAKIDEGAIRRGLLRTRWAGRLEKLGDHPVTIIDGAHNEEGARALAEAIETFLPAHHKTLVFGMLSDKEVDKVLDVLLPCVDEVIVTTPQSNRAMSAQELAEKIQQRGKTAKLFVRPKDAVEEACRIRGDQEAVIYAGSLYLIGEIRPLLRMRHLERPSQF